MGSTTGSTITALALPRPETLNPLDLLGPLEPRPRKGRNIVVGAATTGPTTTG